MAVARPHVMASTLIKAALLLVATLGPRSLMATAVATAAASSLLCLLTTGWLAGFVPRHYSQASQAATRRIRPLPVTPPPAG